MPDFDLQAAERLADRLSRVYGGTREPERTIRAAIERERELVKRLRELERERDLQVRFRWQANERLVRAEKVIEAARNLRPGWPADHPFAQALQEHDRVSLVSTEHPIGPPGCCDEQMCDFHAAQEYDRA